MLGCRVRLMPISSKCRVRFLATSVQLATIEQKLQAAIQETKHPILRIPLSDINFLKSVACSSKDGTISVEACVTPFSVAAGYWEALQEQLTTVISDAAHLGIKESSVTDKLGQVVIKPLPKLHSRKAMADAGKGVAHVGSVIAVSSGKGGVGKSTVAVNLAYALAKRGARVGILDADLHGPSLPVMVKPEDVTVRKDSAGMINALQYQGVKLMSYGWVAPKNKYGERTGAIMRGPLVSSLLQQLVKFTEWGTLDYLVVDMPPGTGDIHITLAQTLPISTAVIVTTPQQLAVVDVVKGLDMFNSMKVPTSALVVNMAHYVAPDTGKIYYPFGHPEEKVKAALSRFSIPKLVSLPMREDISAAGDSGAPFMLQASSLSPVYADLAGHVAQAAEYSATLADGALGSLRNQPSATTLPVVHATTSFDDKQRVIVLRLFREDGAQQMLLDPYKTRLACKCASCVDESRGVPLLDPTTVPRDVTPIVFQPQGNYGVAIQWSDGHASGIFTFDQLSSLAQTSEK